MWRNAGRLTISVPLPDDIAPEWAVIKLWEASHLSTRQAAERLNLTYYDYIELLGARQVPVVREMSEPAELLQALAEIRRSQAGPSSLSE